jgi:hypothetical protein
MKLKTLSYMTLSAIQADSIRTLLRSAQIDSNMVSESSPSHSNIQQLVTNHSAHNWAAGIKGLLIGGGIGIAIGITTGNMLQPSWGFIPSNPDTAWIAISVGGFLGLCVCGLTGLLVGLKVSENQSAITGDTLRKFGTEITVTNVPPDTVSIVRNIFDHSGAIRIPNSNPAG